MSVAITTDIFCDGVDCCNWEYGAGGNRVKANDARENVKKRGWRRQFSKGKLIDVCPECYRTKNFIEPRILNIIN